MNTVALVTEARFECPRGDSTFVRQILTEDRLLAAALKRLGLACERVDWARPGVDWSTYCAALLRTTWDYDRQPAAFNDWLERVDGVTRLYNPRPLLRWNLDKRYLMALAASDVEVVPTTIVERGDRTRLAQWLEQLELEQAVIKPVVSAAGRDTYRINIRQSAGMEDRFSDCVTREAMLIQPFMERILEQGEISLMFFEGDFSHAVRKIARRGEFRVQDDHGGRVVEHQATESAVECARRAVAACPQLPLYARVDLVADGDGQWRVMELELLEPELFLREAPSSAAHLAQGLAGRLGLSA